MPRRMHRIFSELYYAFVEDIDIESEKSACDILCVVGKKGVAILVMSHTFTVC